MSRKQYRGAAHSHEKKLTKKERQAQTQEQRAQAPREEVIPTEEDTAQIKNLALYSVIGIAILMAIMYYFFINN